MRDSSSAAFPLEPAVVHAISTPFQTDGNRETATNVNLLTCSEMTSSSAAPLTAYTGRYTQADYIEHEGLSLSEPELLNPYTYAAANPMLASDPYGLVVKVKKTKPPKPPIPLPDSDVMAALECISNCLGAGVLISDGLRTEEENRKLGGARHSWHLVGKAADIYVFGRRNKNIRQAADACGFYVLAKSYDDGHVHIDLRGGRLPPGPLPLSPPTGYGECFCAGLRE